MRYFKYGFATLLLAFAWLTVVVQVMLYVRDARSPWWTLFTFGSAVVTTWLVAGALEHMKSSDRMKTSLKRMEAVSARFDAGDRSDEFWRELYDALAEWHLLAAESERLLR